MNKSVIEFINNKNNIKLVTPVFLSSYVVLLSHIKLVLVKNVINQCDIKHIRDILDLKLNVDKQLTAERNILIKFEGWRGGNFSVMLELLRKLNINIMEGHSFIKVLEMLGIIPFFSLAHDKAFSYIDKVSIEKANTLINMQYKIVNTTRELSDITREIEPYSLSIDLINIPSILNDILKEVYIYDYEELKNIKPLVFDKNGQLFNNYLNDLVKDEQEMLKLLFPDEVNNEIKIIKNKKELGKLLYEVFFNGISK
jgi:hypothetical protein